MRTVFITQKFDGGFSVQHGGVERAVATTADEALAQASDYIDAFEKMQPSFDGLLYVQQCVETQKEFLLRTLPEAQPDASTLKQIEATCTVWTHQSFPNGSSYSMQKFRHCSDTERFLVSHPLAGGDVRIVDLERQAAYRLSSARISVGPGTDFGMHFCTRNQAMVAFA